MKGKIAALVMAALLALYIFLTLQQALAFLSSGQLPGIIMGAALLIMPVVGAWALYRELLFGIRTEKMVKILASREALPVEQSHTRPSGRPLRDEADEQFAEYRAEVEAASESWVSWFRLGLAYNASGDRRRARQSLRRSIALYRQDPAEHSRA